MKISGIKLNVACKTSEQLEVERKLKALGLTPTGDLEVDKARLVRVLVEKNEKFLLDKAERVPVDDLERKLLEEEKRGAQLLAEQNKIFFNL